MGLEQRLDRDRNGNTKIMVGGIPVIITNNHDEVYPYLQEFSQASVLHIDGHSDMADGVNVGAPPHIGNYLTLASHHDHVGQIYWQNPHHRELKHMGTGKIKDQEPQLRTYIKDEKIFWESEQVTQRTTTKEGLHIQDRLEIQGKDFIVDIDLDAYACNTNKLRPFPKGWFYNRTSKWRQRMELSEELLREAPKPSIILMTRSNGVYGRSIRDWHVFVPPKVQEAVEQESINMLSRVYEFS